jgi:hypothetical protein
VPTVAGSFGAALSIQPLSISANGLYLIAGDNASGTNKFFVDDLGTGYYAGRLGVATNAPQSLFNVNGQMRWGGTTTNYAYSDEDGSGLFVEQVGNSAATSHLRLQASKSGDLTNYAQLNIDANNGFGFMGLAAGNGKLGIGTTTPGLRLDAYESSSTSNVAVLRRGVQGSDSSMVNGYGTPYLQIGGVEYRAGSLQSIGFGYQTGGSYQAAEIGFVTTTTAAYTAGDIVFANRTGTTNVVPTEMMRISSGGNVAIGMRSPYDMSPYDSLDVYGAIRWGYPPEPTNYYARAYLSPNGGGNPDLTTLTFAVQSWPNGGPNNALTLTANGNATVGGHLSVSGNGGNVLHACVTRSVSGAISAGSWQSNTTCNAGEKAISAGGTCSTAGFMIGAATTSGSFDQTTWLWCSANGTAVWYGVCCQY